MAFVGNFSARFGLLRTKSIMADVRDILKKSTDAYFDRFVSLFTVYLHAEKRQALVHCSLHSS